MKYIVFGETKEGLSYEEAVKKGLAIQKERNEKGVSLETHFPSHVFLTEPTKGVIILEVNDEMDIVRYERDYGPLMKMKYIPLIDITKVAELLLK